MYLFTISLLLFSFIITKSTCYEEIPSRRINTGTVNSDDGSCVCFPGGESLIPELSNLEANGLERLVVYLYKNENTNEVYLFQPSAEKQSLIPDISHTSGDFFKPVTTETIVSLFSNYPNTPQSHQPVNTQGEPIGLNIGIVNYESKPNLGFTGFSMKKDANTQLPNKEYVIASESPHSGSYQNQQQSVYSQSKPSQHQQFESSSSDIIGIEPNIIHPRIKPFKSSNFEDSLVQTDVIADTDPGKDAWLFKEEKYSNTLNPYQNKAAVQSVKPRKNHNIHEAELNVPKRLSTFDDWYKEQMETVQNQKISQGVNEIDSDGLRPLVLKTLFDNHLHIGAEGMMIDDNGTPIDLNNLELRPILIGSAVKFQALGLNPQLTFPETLPYLEGILIILIHPFKILGVIPVGKTYVSSPGKSNNPSLKYAYKNSNQIGTKTVTSFSKLPLFAGHQTHTTVKSTNPFKVLDQPLSSESSIFSINHKLPKTLVLTPLDSELTQFPIDSSSWSSFSNSGYNNGYPSAQPLPDQRSSWTSGWGEAIIKSIPSVLNSEATGITMSNRNNLDGSQTLPLVEGDTSIGPTRRFSTPVLKGVLKTLIQMVIDNLVNEKNQEGEQQKKDDETKTSELKVNVTVGSPKALKSARNEDSDGPDFRIIGGSAATGSGSPLSNKGRSGLRII